MAKLNELSTISATQVDKSNDSFYLIHNTAESGDPTYTDKQIKIDELAEALPYDNTASGLTADTVKEAVDELATKLTNIPDPPTTDGTYTLTCTVLNGEATYSWV